jgi:hypothetical protein
MVSSCPLVHPSICLHPLINWKELADFYDGSRIFGKSLQIVNYEISIAVMTASRQK